MKSKDKKMLAIGVVAVIVVAWLLGAFAQWGFPAPQLGTKGTTAPPKWSPSQEDNYKNGIGMFEVSQTCYDSLAPSTALTHVTNYNVYWYTKRGVEWVYHGTGGTVSSPVYIDMTEEDGGYLYVAVTITAAQNYHVDADKIRTTNSWIDQVLFTDVDDDTVNEFVFKYNMKGHSIPTGDFPAITFHAHCFADDTSFNGVSSLADIGAVGATKTTQWLEWDSIFSAAAKAVPITKIEFSVNQTDTTLVQLKQIQIPGRGFLDASNLVFDETATSYRWTYTYGNTYDTAYYYACPTGAKLTKDMDVKVDYTLGATDNVECTLKMWWLDPQAGTQSSDSDASLATIA